MVAEPSASDRLTRRESCGHDLPATPGRRREDPERPRKRLAGMSYQWERGHLRHAIGVGFIVTFATALVLGALLMLLDKLLFRGNLPDHQPWPALVLWLAGGAVGAAAGVRSWHVSHRRMRYLRRMTGVCPACAYDMTGNLTGVWPECGTAWDTPR